MSANSHDVLIIGTGPAGLTAAIYTARAGHKPLIFTGMQPGGQLTTTTEVENFPGFAHGIMGPKLMEEMSAQAERVGTTFVHSMVTKVDFSAQPLKVWTDSEEYHTKAVIIATGATAKTLGLENEWKLMGRGVSTCATCDGFFYKNKTVAVVGGGDSAMEEATYLAKICKEVLLIHRRDVFKASKIMVDRARATENIKFMVPYETTELLSDQSGLTGIKVKNLKSNKVEDLKIDGFFMAIGHKPNSEIFLPFVDIDEHGYIRTTQFTATKTPGVFAAGDIADPVFKQAVTAAGLGCQAAIQATRFIESQH